MVWQRFFLLVLCNSFSYHYYCGQNAHIETFVRHHNVLLITLTCTCLPSRLNRVVSWLWSSHDPSSGKHLVIWLGTSDSPSFGCHLVSLTGRSMSDGITYAINYDIMSCEEDGWAFGCCSTHLANWRFKAWMAFKHSALRFEWDLRPISWSPVPWLPPWCVAGAPSGSSSALRFPPAIVVWHCNLLHHLIPFWQWVQKSAHNTVLDEAESQNIMNLDI